LAALLVAFSSLLWWGGKAEAASNDTLTAVPSAKTPALKPANHLDPNPAKGGGDITAVDGALVPESGPSGTLADIQDKKPTSDQISIYVVRNGDTLSQIAHMFGVSSNTILWSNDLKSAQDIHPGDTLVILPVTGVEYTVKKGDTVAGIAKKFSADSGDILSFNNIDTLTVGDTIIIPNGVEAPAPVAKSSKKGSSKTYEPLIRGYSGPVLDGYFIRPLVGGIKTQGLHGYNGVDIGTPVGTPIMAAAGGTVIIAKSSGYNGGYGEYVVIQHPNGTQTVYGHLSAVYVSPGQHVEQGEVIGHSGNTGKSTGPHLHFEVRGAVNPLGP
jgi:LysM repeat protein